ncbi:MAG: NigD-like protein [Dysgonamonadaceae bacterium]|nr:NigD-like protein [Dysgonamonadaceae bacterium]
MKKSPLLYLGFMASVFILFSMASCLESDGYSLGDFRVNIASVHAEKDGAYSLILDNGENLWPAATNVLYRPKDGQRVFVNYTLLSGEHNGYDHYIKINDLSNILTKEVLVLNAANADSIGNDPVIVKDMWEGGGYLNVSFLFNYGGVKPHAINLVKNELLSKDASDPIELEFRHNAYGSATSRLYEGFACFDLRPFRVSDADSVKFSIKVKEAKDVMKIFDIVYKYNQTADDTETSNTRVTPVTFSEEYY